LTGGSGSSSSGSENQQSSGSENHLPFDYFSYIDTKSRARSKNSSCYFFIEQNYFDSFFRQFAKFKQIETTLIKKYSNLIEINSPIRFVNQNPSVSMIEADGGKLKYISIENSIYLINRYCLRLPSDALTQLSPRFEIYVRLNGDNERFEFKCSLYLPVNSSIHEAIDSDWHVDVYRAKALSAYKACFILFCRNELNELLEPITKEMFYRINHRNDQDDEREW
jgi:endoribonuclease Dicer